MSDRYAGWLGQIYTEENMRGGSLPCTKTLKGNIFSEEVLPGDSVKEYFHISRYWRSTLRSTVRFGIRREMPRKITMF